MNRRHVFKTAVLFPIAWIVGCAEVSQVTSDATTIANGVAAILPTIQTITGISSAVVAKVQAGIAAVKAGASALGSAVASGASTAAQQVAAGVSAVTAALQGVSVPSWVSTVVSAAETLVPLVLQVSGVALAGPPPAAPAIAQARAILLAAAGK